MKPKRLFILLIFLSFTFEVFAQTGQAKFLLDTCFSIMKENAVTPKPINWKTLQKSATSKAGTISDPNELGPTLRYIYKSINDFHGAFYYRDSTFKWLSNQPLVTHVF